MRMEQKRSGEQEYYRLTEEQVLLIRELHVDWMPGSEIGYDGAPCVNSKRPFGNSNVGGDVHEIVDPRTCDEIWNEYDEEDEDAFYEKQLETYNRYYKTLGKALQVVLSSGSFEPGMYSCNKYSRNYQRVTDKNEIFKADLILGDKHEHQDPRYA